MMEDGGVFDVAEEYVLSDTDGSDSDKCNLKHVTGVIQCVQMYKSV